MNDRPRTLDPAADEQASLWAARLEGTTLSAADRNALDAWLNETPVHRALLSSYCQFSADLEQPLAALVGSGAVALPAAAAAHRWFRSPFIAGAALAGAAGLALAVWLLRPPTQTARLSTPLAQRQSLTLVDGTRVELSARTSLQVEISRTGRSVRLASGEAFFAVRKDAARPFLVETPAGSVRVTGTQFDVRTDAAADFEVTVSEGTVQARPGRATAPVTLTAGDQLSANPAGLKVRSLSAAELQDALAWRQGQIVFDGTPLREALARLARYHGRTITVAPEAANLRVGARFNLDDLDEFLAKLEEVLPVRVTRSADGSVQVNLRPDA